MMMRSAPPSCGALRRQPGAGAGADDRAARRHLLAQPGERLVASHAAAPISSWRRSAIAVANAAVVDVRVDLDELDLRRVDALAQRGEQRLVGLRVAERLAVDVDGRHAAQRDEEDGRAGRAVEACSAIRRPSSAISSAVVRMSVIVGLWT